MGQVISTEDDYGDNAKCALALKIIHTVCIYIMSIFFFTGSAFVFPRIQQQSGLNEPYVFLLVGVFFYLAASSIQIYKIRSKGALTITMSSMSLLGGLLWFIGSIFLFSKISNSIAFAALWLLGSLCNLVAITFGIVNTFMSSGPKPLFLTFALVLSWIANLLFFAGSAHILAVENNNNMTVCEQYSAVVDIAGLLLSGSIIYFIHAIFHTLSIFKKGIKFSIDFSSSS